MMDEFQRVALAHPDIEFHFTHNGNEVYQLPSAPIRQRIVHILGSKYSEKLVPVEEATNIVTVNGFIGKPDTAKNREVSSSYSSINALSRIPTSTMR